MSDDASPSNQLSWRVRAYQAIVLLLAVAAIGVMVTITLAGSYTAHYGMSGYLYEHGWPWKFAVRCPGETNRFRFWQGVREFYGWALAGDCLVLVVGIFITVLVGRRATSRPTLSLRYFGIIIALLCIGCAYFAAHRHAALSEQRWVASVNDTAEAFRSRYIGPKWLERLLGDHALLGGSFDRVTAAYVGIVTELFDGHDLARFDYLGLVSFDARYHDDKITMILQDQERWPIRSFTMRGIKGACLKELRRCPKLEDISLLETQIGDSGLKYLEFCPRLESLEIDDSTITAESYSVFARMQRLNTMSLKSSQISEADEAKFASLKLKDLWINGHHYLAGELVDY